MPSSLVYTFYVWYLLFWYVLNKYPHLLSGAHVYLFKINMAGRDMALQHQPFLMTSLKSLQSQHMYDSRFHVSFIRSNRERERERERERTRESLLCVGQYFYCNRTIVQTSVFWNTFCSRVWIFASNVWLLSD